MRAAIYARVSSDAQRERHTIENQLRVLPAFIAAQGWTLVGTYVDDGRSAKTGRLEARDGFHNLAAAAKRGEIDVVAVVDVDRLTRTEDMRERAAILGVFQAAGVSIATPSGGVLDLRTLTGELYATLHAIFAAEENRKRAERIKAGKLRAIADGRKPSGRTPYGLTYDRITGWAVDPEAAAIVREVYSRVIAGESCMAIAEDLGRRGVPPPGDVWERHSTWRIVRSRHPVGEWMADKRRRLVVKLPPIIDEATWSAAQEKLVAHGKRGLLRTKHVYLLEGLAVCGVCGGRIGIRSAGRRLRHHGLQPAAYVCCARRIRRSGRMACWAPILLVAEADGRVWSAIAAALNAPDLAAEVRRRHDEATANRRDWTADAGRYRSRLDRLAKVEAGILGRYRRGAISEAALDHELAELAKERSTIAAQLSAAERAAQEAPEAFIDEPASWLAELRRLAETASPEARQRVVRMLVQPGGAAFDGDRIKLTLMVGKSGGDSEVHPFHRSRQEPATGRQLGR